MRPSSSFFVPAGKRPKTNAAYGYKQLLKRLLNTFKTRSRIVKIRPSYFMITSSLFLIMLFGLHYYASSYVYVVRIDKQVVGYVNNMEEMEYFISDLTDRCSRLYGMQVKPGIGIDIIKEFRPEAVTNSDNVRDAVRQQISFVTEAHLITVDDAPLVPVAAEEDLDEVIENLTASYISNNREVKYLDASLVEDLDIQDCIVSPKSVYTVEEVVLILVNDNDDENEEGAEKFNSLAMVPDPDLNNSYQYNSSYKPPAQSLIGAAEQPGKRFENTIQADTNVNVLTIEEATVTEEIPFSVEIVHDDDMNAAQKEVTSPGQEGKKEVVYHITRKNGNEVERKKVSEEILKEPVPQVETQGTSRLPYNGTGQFIWPVEGGGEITPGQGFSSWHTGIDIASPAGTNVLAADSGVVWFSGYGGAQGYYIIIYHGRYWTLYLHNSVNHVSKGDKVTRGDVIAEVGSTGRSTGPHLHFEVRRDDGSGEWQAYYHHEPIDPLQFFRR